MAALKKRVLRTLIWGRGTNKSSKKPIVVLVDPKGKDAKSGTPIGYFAKLNEKGRRAGELIATLDETRLVYQDTIKDVKTESARAAGKCNAVERALRLASDNQNSLLENFHVEVDKAKALIARVRSARDTMDGALLKLEAAKKKLIQSEIDDETKKNESLFKAIIKERDEAVKEITEITKIAKTLVSKNLINIFTLAVNKAATHSIKAEYAPELAKLGKKIASLKKKSAKISKEIKLVEIEAAAKNFSAGVHAYNAAESEFNASLDAARGAQKNLMNQLDHTPSKALADVMRAHKIQDQRVAIARRVIWEYKTGLQGALKSVSILSLSYKHSDDILKKAAKKDNSYSPGSEYGKAVWGWAFQNGHHLETWKRYAVDEIRYCKEQENYLDDDSFKGPFGGFHRMTAIIKEARGKTRKQLKAAKMDYRKCPV